MGFTTQFFSCTPSEIENLINILSKYIAPSKDYSVAQWVSSVILKSCKNVHGTIAGSKFSEQELFGFSNQIFSNRRQIPIFYFRVWGVHFNLNSFTLLLIKVLGFKHITFEKKNENISPSYISVIKNILYLYYVQKINRFKFLLKM
jgi:hypothetical protein